jgi:hypothetical protein
MFKSKISEVIASRELSDARDRQGRIIASVGLPRRVSPDEWQCPVRIDGLDAKPISKSVPGSDSLQALLLAVEYLRKWLKQSQCELVWPDDGIPCPAGDIPHQVPFYMGEEFVDRIEQLTRRETPRSLDLHFRMLRSRPLEESKKRTSSPERAPSRRPRRSE